MQLGFPLLIESLFWQLALAIILLDYCNNGLMSYDVQY